MAAIFDAPRSTSTGMSPYTAAAAGAAGGVALDRAALSLKQSRARANWGLGISVGLAALAAISASDLNGDQSAAQATIATASALTFTSAGATGEQVAALRSVVVQQGYLLAKIAYDASLFSFSGEPAAPNVTNPAAVAGVVGAITQTTVTSTTNNNVFVLALVVLAVIALILMD